jgi:hypothetical protein
MSFFGSSVPRVIRVQVKSNYGNALVYPLCEVSKLFCKLTGNKTLRMADIEVIKKLGFEVEQMHPEKIFQ